VTVMELSHWRPTWGPLGKSRRKETSQTSNGVDWGRCWAGSRRCGGTRQRLTANSWRASRTWLRGRHAPSSSCGWPLIPVTRRYCGRTLLPGTCHRCSRTLIPVTRRCCRPLNPVTRWSCRPMFPTTHRRKADPCSPRPVGGRPTHLPRDPSARRPTNLPHDPSARRPTHVPRDP